MTIFILHGFLTTIKNRNMLELGCKPLPKEVLDDAEVVSSALLT